MHQPELLFFLWLHNSIGDTTVVYMHHQEVKFFATSCFLTLPVMEMNGDSLMHSSVNSGGPLGAGSDRFVLQEDFLAVVTQ